MNLWINFVVLISVVLVLSLVSAQTTYPQNTAVNAGTPETYLNCSYSGVNQGQFTWSFLNFTTQSSGTTSLVAQGCTAYNSRLYGVDCPTQNTVNLIIRNAQPPQAGLYSCTPGSVTASSAQFIVLDDVTCSTNPTVQVPISQSVQLSCGTQVYGNMEPVMTWSNSGATVPSTPSDSGLNVGATASVQAQIPTVPSYNCIPKFGMPPNGTGYATNIPTYTDSCNTQPLQVLYPPPNATITLNGNPNNISCTDSLTCSAVSYPNSTYTWVLPNGSTSSGPTVTTSQTGQIGNNLVYKCTASNGQPGSAEASITLNITFCPTTTVPPTTTTTATTSTSAAPPPPYTSTNNVGAIVGGVVGGVVGAALVILLIVCCCVSTCPLYNCCRGEKKDKYKETHNSTMSSNRSDVVRPPVTDHIDGNHSHPASEYPTAEKPQNYKYGYHQSDEELNYAELQVDNTPRSRQPFQSNNPQYYVDDYGTEIPYNNSEVRIVPGYGGYNDRVIYEETVKRS